MRIFLVTHTHWDREWYRTFQAFRARLVDTVDSVLALLDEDPGYRFLLDGQSVITEDYLALRPDRSEELSRVVRERRVAVGPWYVQPDSLLPSGEAHVRNLLEGRRVGERVGPVSTVAYTPDSFGHPAQLPQILRGFGLQGFVYWRGNGDEIATLPSEYRWTAPDGTAIVACHMGLGYFCAAALPPDPVEAAGKLAATADELATRSVTGRVLLMNGSDHLPPDPHTGEVARALAERTGHEVRRALLEEYVDGLDDAELPSFTGELVGGRVANLLPGVWSTRTPIKLRNRACERALEGWAEPWAAIGKTLGAPDERPALRLAWRELLQNQAHDSICGCSQDAVHEQMEARYDAAEGLARETTTRVLERIAGLGPQRIAPPTRDLEVAVFNPSPHARTDVVRFPLDPYPPFGSAGEAEVDMHPLLSANLRPRHFTVDGAPARLVPSEPGRRLRLVPEQHDWEVEFVAADVPAFGYRTYRLTPADDDAWDEHDDGTRIGSAHVSVTAAEDGTFEVRIGDALFGGIGALEDLGDRGDTYDFDEVGPPAQPGPATVERLRHASGIEHLIVRRTIDVPRLDAARTARTDETDPVHVTLDASVAPGVGRVDLRVIVDNHARDHRLRLLVPTGRPAERFEAATTFGVADRSTASRPSQDWRHPAPATFPHQGWVRVNGLTVVAPGLNEAEVRPDGTVYVTLLRAVGWLSRHDLVSRPVPAGPAVPTPGAQCLRSVACRLSLLAGDDPRAATDAELGLLAVASSSERLAQPGVALLSLEPRELVLTAVKPSERGPGIVARVLNPSRETAEAALRTRIGLTEARAVRLDETDDAFPVTIDDGIVRFDVPPRALRSVLLT